MIYERGLCTYVTPVFIVEKQHKSIQRVEEQPSLQDKAAAQEQSFVSPPLVLQTRSRRVPNPAVHGSAPPRLLLRGQRRGGAAWEWASCSGSEREVENIPQKPENKGESLRKNITSSERDCEPLSPALLTTEAQPSCKFIGSVVPTGR